MSDQLTLHLSPLAVDEVFAHIIKHGRALILVAEISEWLSISKGHVYNLCDAGDLEEHNLKGPRRVTRRSLVKFLLETANYKPADSETFIKVILLLIEDLNLEGLQVMRSHTQRLIERRTPRTASLPLPFTEPTSQL